MSVPPSPGRAKPPGRRMRLAYKAMGAALVPIGIAGIVLPILPGVPLLIVAAALFARSSPKLEQWLLNHPKYGPPIIAWRETGAIPMSAKLVALPMMGVSAWVIYASIMPLWMKPLAIAGVLGAAIFVATRPNE